MKTIFYILVFTLLISCDDGETERKSGYITITDLNLGYGLELNAPWKVYYKECQKCSLTRGKFFYKNDHVMSFQLNLRLVNNTITPDKWIIADTVSSSLKRDTLIFHWYEKDELQFITVKEIHHNGIRQTEEIYSLWGELNNHFSRKREIQTLFIKIRDHEIRRMFRHDSTLLRNLYKVK